MQKFQVSSITDMINRYPHLPEMFTFKYGDIQVIIITKNEYDLGFSPLLTLDFDDVMKSDKHGTFIQKKHIESIIEKLPEIKKALLVYVCCDAGISRSPAVASALAHFLGDAKSYGNITYRYPFSNNDVFTELLRGLRDKCIKGAKYE